MPSLENFGIKKKTLIMNRAILVKMVKKDKFIIRIIFFSLIFILSLGFFLFGTIGILDYKEMLSWDEVDGEIIGWSHYRTPAVTFQYSYGGGIFESTSYTWHFPDSSAIGQKSRVLVNRNDLTKSELKVAVERDLESYNNWRFIILIFVLIS